MRGRIRRVMAGAQKMDTRGGFSYFLFFFFLIVHNTQAPSRAFQAMAVAQGE